MEFRRLSLPQWKAIKAIPYQVGQLVVGEAPPGVADVLLGVVTLHAPHGDLAEPAVVPCPPKERPERGAVVVDCLVRLAGLAESAQGGLYPVGGQVGQAG